MIDIIHLLPESIANQIAAGEVVQRPASAVKELMENAIDAKSNSIKVYIKDSGKALIQVIDDGAGMSETDARMSFERHATSKIEKAEDLFSIDTFGFRGEALASIAAVSQVEMKTRTADHEIGLLLCIEGSEIKKSEPVNCPAGTSISVKNLFYNIPARRNFLKSNSVEFKHIVDEFLRVALAYKDISFELFHNGEVVYQVKPGKLAQRIVQLFGKSYEQQLVAVAEETSDLKIFGYIGKPEHAKKTRGEQFFFVNSRFIKSSYLNHAVQSSYEDLLADGSFPFFCLFLEMDPKRIDINVHPTKTEVKFDDERTIYGLVKAAIRQSLGLFHVAPSLDFASNVNFNLGGGQSTKKEDAYTKFKDFPKENKSNIDQWEKLYEVYNTPSEKEQPKADLTLTFSSAANRPDDGSKGVEDYRDASKSIFQVHKRYIFSAVKSGVMVVDQELAHERILYERFLDHLNHGNSNAQKLLFPVSISLSPSDFSLVSEIIDEISRLGFSLEIFGTNTIKIDGAPSVSVKTTEKELFEGLLEQFKQNRSELSLSVNENLARAMAKRASIKRGQFLEVEEMSSIIDSLFGCSIPNYTPSGSSTFYILNLGSIEESFK
ncbi:MAG: DNA mismatch repair endonuclease MutL [Bacteroidota bacterium]